MSSDGILLLRETEERGFVAQVVIYNPDGSEAELSGNGVRQAVMYLRRNGWVDTDSFSVRTAAGEIRPHIHGDLCTMDMGRARLRSEADFPAGGEDGTGTVTTAGREFPFQFVQVGNPQCTIEVDEPLDELPLAHLGRDIERDPQFPNRTNVSFWHPTGDAEIHARIFERGVGETMASGTGATGAAVAAVLRGADSPVAVEMAGGRLEVEVGEDMHVSLTGWAKPVYRGELSQAFVEELNAIEVLNATE